MVFYTQMNAPTKQKIKSEFEPKRSAEFVRKSDVVAIRKDLRNKLVVKYKEAQEEELQKVKKRLNKAKTSGILESVLKGSGGGGAANNRSPSVNSISSDDSVFSDSHAKIKKKSKKKGDGSSSLSESAEGKREISNLVTSKSTFICFRINTNAVDAIASNAVPSV